MMKYLPLFLISLCISTLYAVSVSDIENIRLRAESSGSELQSADRQLLDEYWQDALNRMLLLDDAEAIMGIRRQLEAQKGDQPLSLYASTYISVSKDHLRMAFENVARMEDVQKRQLFRQNLMILAAKLKSPALASIILDRIGDEDPVVRYWAVKGVTNSGVIQLLASGTTTAEETKVAILNALKQRLQQEQQVEIQIMMIDFAAAMNHPIARDILLSLADKRIAAYQDWSVVHETVDVKLLITMGNVAIMTNDDGVKSTFARKFAELYSLAFQRYLIGQEQEILSDEQLEKVVTVILEVDKVVLAKMLEVPQTGIFRSMRLKGGLEREYETIFGDRLRSGDLGAKYKFDYGKDASGNPVTEPPKLSASPVAPENTEE